MSTPEPSGWNPSRQTILYLPEKSLFDVGSVHSCVPYQKAVRSHADLWPSPKDQPLLLQAVSFLPNYYRGSCKTCVQSSKTFTGTCLHVGSTVPQDI